MSPGLFSSVFLIVLSKLNRKQQTSEQGLETGGSQSEWGDDAGSVCKPLREPRRTA